MMRQLAGSFEHVNEWDQWEQQAEQDAQRETCDALFNAITNADHIGVTQLAPHVTAIPDIGITLAVRCDVKFNVTQALYGIVRAGNHGFGLVNAYGTDKTKQATTYITKLNDDPYGKMTKLVAPLAPGVKVLLGGASRLEPELSAEGMDFMIHADAKGEVRIKAERLGTKPFEIITAVSSLLNRNEKEYMPLDEVGTWSLPPNYVRGKLGLR